MRQKAAVDGGRDEGRRALVSAASAVGAEFLEAGVALIGLKGVHQTRRSMICLVPLL